MTRRAPMAYTPCAISMSASRPFTADSRGADDYYYRASPQRGVLDRIAVPTLILHSLDDPFIRVRPETRAAIAANPHITLAGAGARWPLRFPRCKPPADDDGYWAETTPAGLPPRPAPNA